MKQKMIALLAFVSVFCSVSAQKVNETVTLYGKDQLQGFTINIDNYSMNLVENAMANLFETQYKLKGSKKKGFHVYENQPCFVFGDAKYDIYFTTAEVGKKKDKTVQVTLVVSTGNMNCITFSNDPRTSRNIVNFLEKFPKDVEAYKIKLRIEELENQLTNLKKENESLNKERAKLEDKIGKTNSEMKSLTESIDSKSKDIVAMQEKFNDTHDPLLQEEIAKAVKDKQTMEKTYSSDQKSLLNLNNSLVKINSKLETNTKKLEETETELKNLK